MDLFILLIAHLHFTMRLGINATFLFSISSFIRLPTLEKCVNANIYLSQFSVKRYQIFDPPIMKPPPSPLEPILYRIASPNNAFVIDGRR